MTINANTGDKINIIGVVLDGIGTTNPFTGGIQFNSGGSLHVQDSVIRNFTQDGIAFAPNSSATPLPAALPLFAGGLSLIGGLGGRRKNSPSEPGELYSRLECHF